MNTKILELKDTNDKCKGLIHIASEKGLAQLVAKLLEEGIDVNTEDSLKGLGEKESKTLKGS